MNAPLAPIRLDLGCGPAKQPGFTGMDVHPYPGVDIVQDIDQAPWNLPDGVCSDIRCIHVIEHVRDLRMFFTELLRISAPGCRILIETPHYTSHNSWSDPTHIHHLGVDFAKPFTSGYLQAQLAGFRVVSTRISFGSVVWTWPGRLAVALFGHRTYERRLCWMFPASSIHVVLERV